MAVLVVAVLYTVNSHGGIYKCIDTQGHIVYSDTACSTKPDRRAVERPPKQEAPHSSIFSAPSEKIRRVIKRFSDDSTANPELPANVTTAKQQAYQCDGRTYCSQMSSCAEAKFFINNCPGTKMDGDNDGIPCESQWCQ